MEVMKSGVKRLIRDEKGQLNIVLILLIVGGLIITPLLGLMGTGLLTGEAYEDTMHALYAADAGVEDALWRIKNVELAEFLGYYDEYDYYNQWLYSLNQSVNDYSVNYTIENVWMPKDIPAPNPETAKWTIEQGTVIIAGSPSFAGGSQYEIKISYNQSCGYFVNAVGIWLPSGFEYVVGSSDLEKASGEPYYCEPAIDPYKGGYAVVWDFISPVAIAGFPNSIKFDFTGPEGQSPDNAVSWINYSTNEDDITAWDADVKVYKISSTATDPDTGKQTTVESYTSRIELRKLGSAISGDYHAIGNTLMTATGNEQYRDRLFKESSAEVAPGDIPSTATIQGAWLYWSGWIEGGAEEGSAEEVYSEDCHDFSDWLYGSHWSVAPPYGGGDKEFEGQGGGSDAARTLTMHIGGKPTHSLDLSPYSGREVTISWSQRESESGYGYPPPRLESGDCLKYAFSGNGGTSWSAWNTAFCDDNPSSSFSDTIPPEYVTDNFKMRFLLDFDETNEYCYIDDISISASPAGGTVVEDAKVNRVMFNGNPITALPGDCQIAPTQESGAPDSWCYSCFCDVTDLVNQSIEDGYIASNGAGTYTVGHVLEGSGYSLYPSGTTGYPLGTPALSTALKYQWSYAGWSLIIIYSSPETKGHQLFLFEDLHYVAVCTTLDFPIRGFLVPDPVEGELYAAHMTCFIGDGDEHYSGDFIALNAPSVPSNEIPDAYKLWDGITVPSIRTFWSHQYFPNNASSPNNVWNSQSPGLTANGVDIDNFDITWSSGLLEPGDTTAEVSLGNASSNEMDAELIMVVYIIISFRSETTSGGVIGYLIK
jgi:hypothetical protein